MGDLQENMQDTELTLKVAKYDTKNGLQMHLSFKNTEKYFGSTSMVQIVVLDGKIYFEPSESGNRLQKGRLMIIARGELLKEFENLLGEYLLHYDEDMDMLYINAKDQPIRQATQITYSKTSKKKKGKTGGKNMNMAGKKGAAKTASAKQAEDLLKNLKPMSTVEKVAINAATGKTKPDTAEPVVEDKVNTEKVPEVKKEEKEQSLPKAADGDYKSTIIELMSAWTAEMMKGKDFESAKKLIDITTEIDNI